ncbi:unnamed protein product [Blepharisma stoltei]|uniref:FAM192A/Fyv6 N-terminal domain-containing protein n=1 Tax=Blepharisma stoltei TaxID=1481888 RepID=A0AAU9JHG3_9CILI|nr:unnamed protein product [Blepharisma stoltei]
MALLSNAQILRSHSSDLKAEYLRKLNELELEKEEAEYYKRSYKRKVEKLNQEKRNYQAKVAELAIRMTPNHTEESSSDKSFDFEDCPIPFQNGEREPKENFHEKEEEEALAREREALNELKEQVEQELSKLRREKHKLSVHQRISMQSQSKFSDYNRPIEITRNKILSKCGSLDKINSPEPTDLEQEQREIEQVRITLAQKQKILEDAYKKVQEERAALEKDKKEFEEKVSGFIKTGEKVKMTPKTTPKVPKSPLRFREINQSAARLIF